MSTSIAISTRAARSEHSSSREDIALAAGIRGSDIIAGRAKDWDVDLIVMGVRGRDAVGRFRPGPVAQKVLHQTEVPVMLVK